MKNARAISMGAAVLAGLIGLIPTLGILLVSDGDIFIGSAVVATEILIALTALLALASAGFGMVLNPGNLRKTAISIAALLAACLISYLMSSGADFASYNDVTEATSKWVSFGLNAFYVTFLLGLGAVGYSLIHGMRQ